MVRILVIINLILCFNREAVEHFLTALSQQNQANIMQFNDENESAKPNYMIKSSTNQMSETIWSTLRLAMSYLNRTDLYARCASKDLNYLKNEFNIE